MKKLICLALAVALMALSLTGCRRKAEEETSADGPGYTATDGSVFMPEGEENSVPDPLATLTPQQRAAMQVGTPDETLEGEGAMPPEDMPVAEDVPAVETQTANDDLFAAIDMGGNPEATATVNPAFDMRYTTTGGMSTELDTSFDSNTAINPSTYQYAAVMDDSLDYTFNYPTSWENIPGIYTVCYREKVEKGDFPARISICRKKLVHTPDDIAMMEQLTSYMKMVAERYDAATFQTSTPDKEARFMGHQALANTYLAYWGDVEIKGYVVGVAIDRTLYVLHFCATYADYAALSGVLQYMVNSVRLKEEAK